MRQLLKAGVGVAAAESFSADVCGSLKKLKVSSSLAASRWLKLKLKNSYCFYFEG